MRNDPDLRRCYLCKETKPATVEHFPKDKNRFLGIGYQCRPCALRVRRERGDSRKNRWKTLMTPEQRTKKSALSRKYFAGGGWRFAKVAAYESFDKERGLACNMTTEWFEKNIQNKPCIYCGRSKVRIGCDRIDNSLGHTIANVVPSCGDCNKSRQDIFTHKEMLQLGPHISAIFARREKQIRNA